MLTLDWNIRDWLIELKIKSIKMRFWSKYKCAKCNILTKLTQKAKDLSSVGEVGRVCRINPRPTFIFPWLTRGTSHTLSMDFPYLPPLCSKQHLTLSLSLSLSQIQPSLYSVSLHGIWLKKSRKQWNRAQAVPTALSLLCLLMMR